MARVRINTGQLKKIRSSDEMVAAVHEKAEQAAQTARAIAPDAPPIGEGYVAGIEAVSGIEKRRALGRVNANDWKSHFIEFGTGGQSPTEAFRVLGRALDSIAED